MSARLGLGSLALDLYRVAQGYHRGSTVMATRFVREVKARRKELQNEDLQPYLRKLLGQINEVLSQKDHQKLAEDALMYSILFQNAAVILPED